MGLAKVGDKVVVVRTYAEYEEVYIGEVGTVKIVHPFSDGDVYEVELEGGGVKEFYEDEVELHAEAPKDYDETIDKPVIDEDLAHLSDGDQELYHEIVTGLSQAIAHKAKQMGSDKPRLMGEHVSLGCETPTVDMPEEEDDSDAAIYKELRGHRQSEVFGILQDGITHEQALAARDRALAKKRKDDLDNARKALEEAQKRYEEVAGKEADGDIPKASMTIQLDGKDIAESLFSYGKIEGHPHGITRIKPGPERPSDYELTEEDREWMEMEDVGREVIYDSYNPDVVKAPAHYVNSGIEPIQYMADKLPAYDDGHTAFCVGNVIKYVSRAPHKGKLVEDLKKARQYLDFAIEHEEKKQN